MTDRLPVVLIIITAGLICYILSKRPALNSKEKKELKRLDNVIAELFGGK